MPDTKISDMIPSTGVANAAILPIVAGAANYKASKQLFLSGVMGEDIDFQANGANHAGLLSGTGASQVFVDDTLGIRGVIGAGLNITDVGNTFGITLNNIGSGSFRCGAAGQLTLGAPGGATRIFIDDMATTIQLFAAAGVTVPFAPGLPASWAGAPPASMNAALDRLAAAFNALVPPVFP